jgi:stress response protein YsnF
MTFDESINSENDPETIDVCKMTSTPRVLTDEVISLLEERLMVSFTRQKIGEIVVRREIETRILQVQVPIRHEKLIIEQVSPEYKQLAEIDLGQGNTQSIVSGEVDSPEDAIDLLREIVNMPVQDCETVRIEIVLKNSKHQSSYQELFDRYC